jgi:hypothetical protein
MAVRERVGDRHGVDRRVRNLSPSCQLACRVGATTSRPAGMQAGGKTNIWSK